MIRHPGCSNRIYYSCNKKTTACFSDTMTYTVCVNWSNPHMRAVWFLFHPGLILEEWLVDGTVQRKTYIFCCVFVASVWGGERKRETQLIHGTNWLNKRSPWLCSRKMIYQSLLSAASWYAQALPVRNLPGQNFLPISSLLNSRWRPTRCSGSWTVSCVVVVRTREH